MAIEDLFIAKDLQQAKSINEIIEHLKHYPDDAAHFVDQNHGTRLRNQITKPDQLYLILTTIPASHTTHAEKLVSALLQDPKRKDNVLKAVTKKVVNGNESALYDLIDISEFGFGNNNGLLQAIIRHPKIIPSFVTAQGDFLKLIKTKETFIRVVKKLITANEYRIAFNISINREIQSKNFTPITNLLNSNGCNHLMEFITSQNTLNLITSETQLANLFKAKHEFSSVLALIDDQRILTIIITNPDLIQTMTDKEVAASIKKITARYL